MRKRVLLVATELELRARFAHRLHSSGYAVELACNEQRALMLAAEDNFHVAIVAVEPSSNSLAMFQQLCDRVPEMIVLADGPDEIARWRRELTSVHAFFLKTADEGAVVTRVGEMTASVDSKSSPVLGVLCIEDCKLDFAGCVFVDACGREVALTRAESNLLKELASSPCQVLSREQLRRAVAGRGAEPFDRSIDMLVARLRRKIEPDPKAARFLVTVPGVGYKLMARPQSADARPPRAEPAEPERRQLTALACNLVGAMGFAVNLDPEDLSRVTRNFQDAVIAAITPMGGTIATMAPDQILVLFGYPEAHEDDAERAVEAGLDVVAKIGQLRSPLGEPLQAQVAIATGLALASQNQAVGEPGAIVAGLCNLAAPQSVLVAASTRRLLSGAFVCGNPELYELVGLSQPVSACRVTRKRTVESRFRAKRLNRITRLVGSDQERQRLLALWDRAKSGEGQVALVSGDAGIGKSHLSEAFLGHIAKEPHATIRYQCSPQHLNSPFFPVISQLEHALRLEPMDAPEIKLKKLEAALSPTLGASQDDISLYAALLSIATPAREPSPTATRQRIKDLTIAALTRYLLNLADKRPLVIVLADAHWIDSSTLELINRTIPLIKTTSVFLLIEFRPEFIPQWVGEPHVTTLQLGPLGREQSRTIISEVTGGKELPPEVEEQIIDKTDGVPLFVKELTKTVLESELLQDIGDQFVAAGPLPALAVPSTLLDSLTARLDRLGPAKEVAQIGAVIGREFSYQLLAAVVPLSANALKAALQRLVASELIFVGADLANETYTFKHAIVQDAAYAMLLRQKRQQLHCRVADTLENSFAFMIEAQPELLAHHLAQAGSIERAIDYLRKAGQRSIERSANAEAIGHLTDALGLLQSLPNSPKRKQTRLDLQVMMAQAMIASHGYAAPSTRRKLLQAKQLIDESTCLSQKFAILYGMWACHYVGGEVDKQRDVAQEFLAEAERTDDTAVRCVGHRILGTTYVTMGEFASGLHHLKQARALYDPEHHADYRHQYGQDIGAAALCYLSWALWHLGHFDQASEVATEAMKLAEKLSHPHTLVYTICHARAFMDLFRGRCEDIQSYANLLVSICDESGFSHWRNYGRILGGWVAICGGDVDRGTEVLRKAVGGWQKGGARLWMPIFLILEAEGHVKAGRAEAALQVVEQALAICEHSGEHWAMAEVLRTKARILLSTGRPKSDEIEAILLDSLEIARRQQARYWELRTSCDLARLWQGQRRNKEALKLLQSVCDQFEEGLDVADLGNARALVRCLRHEVTRKPARFSTRRQARSRLRIHQSRRQLQPAKDRGSSARNGRTRTGENEAGR
jgi:DNA-binding response OmpR family regulator/class 3 adenylate cyclase/predicted ATPase